MKPERLKANTTIVQRFVLRGEQHTLIYKLDDDIEVTTVCDIVFNRLYEAMECSVQSRDELHDAVSTQINNIFKAQNQIT